MREIRMRSWNGKGFHYWGFDIEGRMWTGPALSTTKGYSGQVHQMFTGLHDKNGKEIYEGDIVEWGSETSFAKWNSRTASFRLFPVCLYRFCKDHEGSLGESKKFIDCVQYKVIGNIYENPDLLGGE